jgi:hypothetical protein
MGLFEGLGLEKAVFIKFMTKIYQGYRRDVEYHNDIHGADVMQYSYLVLQKWGLRHLAELSNLDVLSTLVAAACHDYNHDGYKNEYHVNVISDRAIRYSD